MEGSPAIWRKMLALAVPPICSLVNGQTPKICGWGCTNPQKSDPILTQNGPQFAAGVFCNFCNFSGFSVLLLGTWDLGAWAAPPPYGLYLSSLWQQQHNGDDFVCVYNSKCQLKLMASYNVQKEPQKVTQYEVMIHQICRAHCS